MFYQSPEEGVVNVLCGGCNFIFPSYVGVVQKRFEQPSQRLVSNTGDDPPQFRKHDFRIPRRGWKEIGLVHRLGRLFLNLVKSQLQAAMMDLEQSPHPDEIIPIEAI